MLGVSALALALARTKPARGFESQGLAKLRPSSGQALAKRRRCRPGAVRSGFLSNVLRRTVTVVLAVVAAATAATAIASAAAAPQRVRIRPRAGSATTFSHAVVVDEQRPGFEPDVKVDGNGVIYTSVPFGFSTTQSFVWASRDSGNSYQLTPGNIGPGKPTTCVGGGDTDLFLDTHNALYFSDLQGLTNISNSMSTDGGAHWTTNCVGAPNTPDDRMWFAGTGSSAGGNLVLYQDFDATDTSASGGNQLVETVSTDGTHFLPVVNENAANDCLGVALQDCVTNNEGISGNQVVDPSTGNLYIAHTTTEGSGGEVGVRVSEGKVTLGTPTTAKWSESPNLDASLCANPTCVDSSGNPEELAGENFASIARDSAGYLYVAFTAGPLDHASSSDPSFGYLTAPEQIYVVHSLEPAGSDPSTLTWSAPERISGSGNTTGTNTFPWVTAGSNGRVDVAWYHTDELSETGTCPASGSGTCTLYGAGQFKHAEWTVVMGQSLNANAANPTYNTTQVSEAPVKHGQICTNGIGCTTGGDRSLGDFLQVTPDNQGAAVVSYVFDTSADTSAGEDAGPEVISRQISGPSLFAADGNVKQGTGPGLAMGSVTDPTGDDYYSANGSRTPAGANLDLTGASLANGKNNTLIATIHVRSLSSLKVSSSLGGPDASWMMRWTVVDPGTTGNGHIFYAGMDNNQGTTGSSKPSFFVGDTSGLPPPNPGEHTKYITYPQTHKLSSSQASYDAKTGTITMSFLRSDVGSPSDGTRLYSITAFSDTSSTPQSSTNLFNLTDATTPFELVIGAPGTVNGPGTGGSGGGNANCPAATGRLSGQQLGKLKLGMTRTKARRTLKRYSTHHRRYMDFFCLRPSGIRAGYASPALLRTLSKRARRRERGRIVLLLTANHHYALRGVRPGAKLRKVARKLHVGRRFRVGKNYWYLTPNGSSHGLIKVRHGVIEEIGIAAKALTGNARIDRKFLRTFGT
jgi:hypothetical protein